VLVIALTFISGLLGLATLFALLPLWARYIRKAFRDDETWNPLYLMLGGVAMAFGITLLGVTAWLAVAF
jgi:hypothetical protein